MLKKIYLTATITLLLNSFSFSQALVPDPTFGSGTGFDNRIGAAALQDDNKVVIGGAFNSYNGNSVGRVVRINPDGSLDNSFNNEFATGYIAIYTVAIQDDGKILAGGTGAFFSSGGPTIKNFIRLNADGTIDNSFDTGSGFDELVETIIPLNNGKVLIGGDFKKYKGTRVDGIARINSDGTLDTSFDTNPGFNTFNTPEVQAIAIQSDGKIVAGGKFSKFNGVTVENIVRFNTDGTVDNSFNIGTGFNKRVEEVTIQSDGKILVGGRFDDYNGTSATRIIRLNTDGSVDNSFNTGTGFSNTVNKIVTQDDGKILVGGWFYSFNGEPIGKFIRLNSDGSKDNSFNIGTGFDSTVESIIVLNDKRTLVGGWFEEYNGTPAGSIVRLMTGPLDLNMEDLADNIKMYPNPTANQVQIAVPNAQTEIRIFDLNGKLVYTKVLNTNNEIITTHDLTNGIYNVQFISANAVTNKKLVINR